MSPLSKKKLKEAPGPQSEAPLLTSELPELFTDTLLFYIDLLRVRQKVPTKQRQKPCITKPSSTTLSPLGSELFFPFLKEHNLHVLLGASLPSLYGMLGSQTWDFYKIRRAETTFCSPSVKTTILHNKNDPKPDALKKE